MKGVPRLRFHDKGNRMEKAFGMGASVKELRVVRTPLRTELHVVLNTLTEKCLSVLSPTRLA